MSRSADGKFGDAPVTRNVVMQALLDAMRSRTMTCMAGAGDVQSAAAIRDLAQAYAALAALGLPGAA